MFTYLIGWSTINRYYYGCRYSKNSHPSQLWTTYFTSSKVVAAMRKKFGEPDIIQIRKTFSDKNSCLLWEHRVLRRLNAADNAKWLNVTNGSLFANCSHKVVVKDAVTGVLVGAVDESHPLYVSGEYIFHLKGVPTNRPSPLKGKPRNNMRGTTLVVDQVTGNCFRLPLSDPRVASGELVPWLSVYCHAIDPQTNETISVRRDDSRLENGSLLHVSKGMVPVKDPNNPSVRLSVSKDDPRLLSGELVHVRSGLKSKDPMKASRPKEKNGRWNGISDEQYKQMIVKQIEAVNNSLRWAQLASIVELPKSRYHIRQDIEAEYNLPTYR